MNGFDTNLDARMVSTMAETDKKCPSCFGVMEFDPETGGLSCPYCGHTEAIPANSRQREAAVELPLGSAEQTENFDWGMETKIVICKACGAESVYDALELASVCPFCGSNQVMEASDQNAMVPGGVVPFQITDERRPPCSEHGLKRNGSVQTLPKKARKQSISREFIFHTGLLMRIQVLPIRENLERIKSEKERTARTRYIPHGIRLRAAMKSGLMTN